MTNRASDVILIGVRAALAAGVLCAGVALSGCKKEEPPPPPPPPPARVAQPVDAQSFVGDPRVQFPQAHAPVDESLARAAADLASALASGDAAALGAMLDGPSKRVLAEQVESGAWSSETGGIEVVRVVGLSAEGDSATLTLAVQDPRGAYLLAWRGVRSGEAWIFGGAESPDARAPRASDLDGAVAG